MVMRVNFSKISYSGLLRSDSKNNPIRKKSTPKEFENSSGVDLKTILGRISADKSLEINKVKKELIKAYDLIYEDMAKEIKALGMDFQKPELVFRRMKKDMCACYVSSQNKIFINTEKLSPRSNVRFDNGTYAIQDLSNGLEIPVIDFAIPFYEKPPKDAIYIHGDEKIFSLSGTLRHELTHARQEQIIINTKDGVRVLYEKLKEKHPKQYKNIEFADFLKMFPFFDKKDSLPCFELNQQIEFSYPDLLDSNGKPFKISYSPLDLINLKIDYDFDDIDRYYADLGEIEARAEQAEFYFNYKNYLPNLKITPQIKDYYFDCMAYICNALKK